MKKIGILTFHRAYNYGAVLQCYALQQYLKKQGADVYVIDYKQTWIDGCFKAFSWTLFKEYSKKPRRLYGYLKGIFHRKQVMDVRRKYFVSFRQKYLKLTTLVKSNEQIPHDLDVYVIGSDQLWAKQCLGNKFDNVYLGKFSHLKNSKIIGYAISTNKISIKELQNNDLLNSSIDNFDAISFREEEIANYIAEMTKLTIPNVCHDPTLLLSANDWENLINNYWKSRKYVAVYQVRGNKQQQQYVLNAANRISKEIGNDIEVIDLSSMKYSVEDFVSIIKFASYVVTSSFHATVFSIIFKTSFKAVLLDDGLDSRYLNLIDSLKLSHVTCHVGDKISYMNTNYTDIEDNLYSLKQFSTNYLKRFL